MASPSIPRQAQWEHGSVLAVTGPHRPADRPPERQRSRPRRDPAGELQREECGADVSDTDGTPHACHAFTTHTHTHTESTPSAHDTLRNMSDL